MATVRKVNDAAKAAGIAGVQNEVEALSRKPAAGWTEPAALTLDERGMICDCNKAGEDLFGYSRPEMTWQHVTRLLPQLDGIKLVQDGQINPLLIFLSRCGHRFQLRNCRGGTIPSELSFVNVGYTGKLMLRLIVRPTITKAA